MYVLTISATARYNQCSCGSTLNAALTDDSSRIPAAMMAR